MNDSDSNEVILSGIQPSGQLHLGNLIGALRHWVDLQDTATCYFSIVDLHAITATYRPAELREQVLHTTALYLAAGIDPAKSAIFMQSHVPAHSELAWLLTTQTAFGELSRMTQFKDKSQKGTEATAGLFVYPVLMAADVLLYQATHVPIGDDQIQHLELTRDLAKRFNNKFNDVFTVPKAYVGKRGARIMSLDDPSKKMSKSGESDGGRIGLLDSPDVIRKKIGSAVTDTEPVFSFTESGAGVQNLLTIYEAVTHMTPEEIEAEFADSGYKDFKEALTEAVIDYLTPLQERYAKLRTDEQHLHNTLADGAQQARDVATTTLRRAQEVMGLVVSS